MAPRITSAEQVFKVAQMMKYPPVGIRGSALGRGWTNFKGGPVAETMSHANEQTMLVVQIETRESIEHLDSILSVPNVDAALIGPNDLSIALGVPGDLSSPVLHSAIERTIAACQRRGVVPAIHVNDLDSAAHWLSKGMKLISVNSEMGFLTRAAREMTAHLQKADQQLKKLR